MKLRVHYFLLIALAWKLLFITHMFSYAQQSAPIVPTLRFTHYTTDDGLSNNSVRTILQDKRGFIWLGTRDGLSRFDAYKFTTFSTSPNTHGNFSNGLSDSYILELVQNPTNERIWIGTNNGGLNYFDYQSNKFYHYPIASKGKNGLADLTVQALAVELVSEEIIWIGTKRKGLQRLHVAKNEFVNFVANEKDSSSLADNNVVDLLFDTKNRLWVASFVIQRLENDKFITYTFPNESGKANISSFFLDTSTGTLWVATWNEGIYLFDTQKEEFIKHIPAPPVTALTQDTKGIIWVSSFGAGVFTYDQNGVFKNHYKVDTEHDYGLKEALAWDILADRQGGVWLGLYAEGLHYFAPHNEQFTLWTAPLEGFRSTTTWDILAENDSVVWVATDRGLHQATFSQKYQQVKTKLFRPDAASKNFQIPEALVTVLLKDDQQNLWIGTWNGLAKRTPNGQLFVFPTERGSPKALAGNKITALGNSDKYIWVGMLYGLARFDKESKTFTHYFPNPKDSNSLNEGYVSAILTRKDGTTWIGTQNGLHRYNPTSDNFERILKNDTKNSLSHNQINAPFEDQNGTLWIGTNGGLNRYHNQQFEVFTTQDGLPSNVIQGIEQDTNGNLWLTTNKGLSFFDMKTQQFTNYDQLDGLQSNDFKRGAITRLPNGVIFVGGKKGFNAFHPDFLVKNSFPPQVAFTNFKLFGKEVLPTDSVENTLLTKPISETKEITLSYRDKVIEFDFTALSFQLPQKTRFAYQMEGFDKDWNYTDAARRFATYTSLPAGTYTFKVKAANADGVWGEEKSILIYVTPPFYQTWAFRIAVPLIIFALGYLFYRNRVAMIKKRNQLLEQTVQERTQEINTKNEELRAINEDLNERNQEILVQNEELEQQREEILAQRDAIEEQNYKLKDLNAAIEKSYQNLNTLTSIGQQITSVLELREVIRQVYERVQTLMPAEGFGIGLYREETNTLFYTGYIEQGKVLQDHHETLDENSFGNWVLRHQKPLLINDLKDEYHHYINQLKDEIEGEEPQSLLYIPLVLAGRKIGVLTVQSFEKHAYTQQHVSILESLGTYIAIAIQNAETYQKLDLAHEQTNHINTKLTDSIRYAETIQQAILSVYAKVHESFAACQIIYRPASGVSGDFYWFRSMRINKNTVSLCETLKDNIQDDFFARILVVADCTGHGVPGAFMSLIGNGLLNEIVLQRKIIEPKYILEELHKGLRTLLQQDKEQNPNQDGMDVAVCLIIDMENETQDKYKVIFSGAKRPMYYSKNNQLYVIKGDKKSVGGRQKEGRRVFTEQQVLLAKNDKIYLFTDGFADQNNAALERIGSKQLFDFVATIQQLPVAEQRKKLEEFLDNHQQDQPQRDDITFLIAQL